MEPTLQALNEFKGLWASQLLELKDFMAKYEAEKTLAGTASSETKTAMNKIAGEMLVLGDRILGIEQKLAKSQAWDGQPRQSQSIGSRFINSDAFKSAKARGSHVTGQVDVGSFYAITSDSVDGSPALPQAARMGIYTEPKQMLRLRDLLTVRPTTSQSIEFIRYTFTNAAAIVFESSPTGSPVNMYENVAKPESSLAFSLETAPVRTIAHWIPASKQIMDDVPQLQGILDQEMRFGLMLVEESEVLTGSGTSGHLNGLITQATAYNAALNASGDTQLDTLRHAILQARLAQYPVDGMVLNPQDVHDIELIKTTGDSSSGQYIIGTPRGPALTSPIWGKPVVECDSMPVGDFLVGSFGMSAVLYDREQASVEIRDTHEDFFIKNMLAIRAEERVALVVPRPQGFIYGSF